MSSELEPSKILRFPVERVRPVLFGKEDRVAPLRPGSRLRRRRRFETPEKVICAVAATILFVAAASQGDQIKNTANSAINRAADGFTNPPGIQKSNRYLEMYKARRAIEEQFNTQRQNARAESQEQRTTLHNNLLVK